MKTKYSTLFKKSLFNATFLKRRFSIFNRLHSCSSLLSSAAAADRLVPLLPSPLASPPPPTPHKFSVADPNFKNEDPDPIIWEKAFFVIEIMSRDYENMLAISICLKSPYQRFGSNQDKKKDPDLLSTNFNLTQKIQQ